MSQALRPTKARTSEANPDASPVDDEGRIGHFLGVKEDITALDQHSTDPEGGTFFLRMEFHLDRLQERDGRGRLRGRRSRGSRPHAGAVRGSSS